MVEFTLRTKTVKAARKKYNPDRSQEGSDVMLNQSGGIGQRSNSVSPDKPVSDKIDKKQLHNQDKDEENLSQKKGQKPAAPVSKALNKAGSEEDEKIQKQKASELQQKQVV